MTRTLAPDQRLALQLLHLGTYTDLRRYRGRPEVREAFHAARRLVRDSWGGLSRSSLTDEMWKRETAVDWAINRCRSRLGMEHSGYYPADQKPEKHDYAADLRLILDYIEEIR